MLFFEGLCLPCLGFQVSVDLPLVGVVVGESRMHLRQIRGGRPCIAGTGVSVRRIAQWHNMGLIPQEIVRKFGHLGSE